MGISFSLSTKAHNSGFMCIQISVQNRWRAIFCTSFHFLSLLIVKAFASLDDKNHGRLVVSWLDGWSKSSTPLLWSPLTMQLDLPDGPNIWSYVWFSDTITLWERQTIFPELMARLIRSKRVRATFIRYCWLGGYSCCCCRWLSQVGGLS